VYPHSITQNSRMLFEHVEDGGFMEGSTKHLGNAGAAAGSSWQTGERERQQETTTDLRDTKTIRRGLCLKRTVLAFLNAMKFSIFKLWHDHMISYLMP
jgi:hypothetical protein